LCLTEMDVEDQAGGYTDGSLENLTRREQDL
jgi:hypothetical protein